MMMMMWMTFVTTMTIVMTVSLTNDDDDDDDADIGWTADDLAQRQGNEDCRKAITDYLADRSTVTSDQHETSSPVHAAAASRVN